MLYVLCVMYISCVCKCCGSSSQQRDQTCRCLYPHENHPPTKILNLPGGSGKFNLPSRLHTFIMQLPLLQLLLRRHLSIPSSSPSAAAAFFRKSHGATFRLFIKKSRNKCIYVLFIIRLAAKTKGMKNLADSSRNSVVLV